MIMNTQTQGQLPFDNEVPRLRAQIARYKAELEHMRREIEELTAALKNVPMTDPRNQDWD